MKKSITEVYQKFYHDNLRNLFLLNFLIIGILVILLISNAYDKALNNANNIIESNRNYITGLILAGGEETINDFLAGENRKSWVHYFKYVPNNQIQDVSGMHAVQLSLGSESLGKLYYGIRITKVIPWMSILMLFIVSSVFIFFMKLALDRASKFLEQEIVIPMKNLSSSVQGSNSVLDLSQFQENTRDIQEITLIKDAFIEFTGKLIDSEVAIAKTKVAQQVAHDIRSPLSALEMISSNLTALEQDKRLIIRNSINRIRDIANTLSKDHRTKAVEAKTDDHEITLLSSVIEMIVTEKRYEISRKSNIQINFDQSLQSYGLFANTVLSELKRILSNLLNNSIEAIGERVGVIDISLFSNSDNVQIQITDNGCGLSEDELARVLKDRVSLKRKSGIGLGLSHAIDSIESWGGKLFVESKKNSGTKMTISLKQQPAPAWFVDAIKIGSTSSLIVFDDDQTVHHMWDSRFEYIKKMLPEFKIHHFKDRDELEKFYGKNFADLDDAIFLMDFEIHDQGISGLDLIEYLGIQGQSVMVTSHYEDETIRQRCLRLGVGIIPKPMAGFVKIKVS